MKNLQIENINKSIESAKLLIVRLKAMSERSSDDPHYPFLKKAAQLDLNSLNYSLQTVL